MTSKGPRVAKATDRHGKPVYSWMLRQKPWPFVEPLTCSACSRPVSIVPAHLRRGSPVAAHFRLHEGHDAGCALNPTRIIEEIARGSQGLATIGADGTLRLTIPAQDTPHQPAPEPPHAEPEDEDEQATLRITTMRPWLPPALNSAVKVAQFLRRCGFDPELAEMFTIEYRRRKIPWQRFCYGPDDLSYGQLHQRVSTATGRLKHPVAVHGTVVRTGTAGRKPFAVLAAKVAPISGSRSIEVVLRSAFPALLGDLEVGMQVLAVGAGWKIFTQHKRNVDEVQLWVTEHWHLAYWTWDENTEQTGTPTCPPPLTPAERRAADAQRAAARRAGGRPNGPLSPKRTAPGSLATRRAQSPPPRRDPVSNQDSPARKPHDEPAPAPAQKESSGDLARFTWEAYTKPSSTPTRPRSGPGPRPGWRTADRAVRNHLPRATAVAIAAHCVKTV